MTLVLGVILGCVVILLKVQTILVITRREEPKML
jgi:hypothetical protein